jgi:hypothetical protein
MNRNILRPWVQTVALSRNALKISGTLNGTNGMSDIEGKAARGRGDEVRVTTEFQTQEPAL